MKTSDFDYNLPEELIAQTPLENRSSSRLLVVDTSKVKKEATSTDIDIAKSAQPSSSKEFSNAFSNYRFSDIIDYLNPGDALVINETKVLPARFYGYRADTGSKIEVLLLKPLPCKTPGCCSWECLTRPQKRLRAETSRSLYFFKEEDDNTPLFGAHVEELLEDGITHLTFTCDNKKLLENLDQIGTMPLPPYIHEKLKDQGRYQTIYAKNLGSAAAPTAGLHFTPDLLGEIEKKGVKIIKITLHVGLGTFRPVQVDDVKNHKMHIEEYEITEKAAREIEQIRKNGGRIIAVGTTSVRTLEAVASRHDGKIVAERGETDIFIYPGYQFQAVDALITNFHLPKSTLLMLVSAFLEQKLAENSPKTTPEADLSKSAMPGRDLILKAYQHAIDSEYRFFSFGDAMLIL